MHLQGSNSRLFIHIVVFFSWDKGKKGGKLACILIERGTEGVTLQRIFQLALDVFQPVRELQHVLFFVLLEYLQLNVKGFIPDSPQLLQMGKGRIKK